MMNVATDTSCDLAFDVRDFGARGDGVTDDRASIQACIDHASTIAAAKANAFETLN